MNLAWRVLAKDDAMRPTQFRLSHYRSGRGTNAHDFPSSTSDFCPGGLRDCEDIVFRGETCEEP